MQQRNREPPSPKDPISPEDVPQVAVPPEGGSFRPGGLKLSPVSLPAQGKQPPATPQQQALPCPVAPIQPDATSTGSNTTGTATNGGHGASS